MKNRELTNALEEALSCAELKSDQVEKLTREVEEMKSEKLAELRKQAEQKDHDHHEQLQSNKKEHEVCFKLESLVCTVSTAFFRKNGACTFLTKTYR